MAIRRDAHDDGVVVLVLDRPDRRNALDADDLATVHRHVLAAAADPGTRALVFTGAGGHLTAGADISAAVDTAFARAFADFVAAVRAVPCPTLCAAEGVALGGGTQLAVSCDLRVAAPDARFGIPAARLGLMIDQATVSRLAAVAGQGTARAMLLGGEIVSGERAHDVGLVQRLGHLDAALAWAAEIAELAPLSLAGHKVGLDRAADADVTPDYADAHARAWASEDLQEGFAAFRERRTPRFHGR
ncbi:MAG: enoyl-CoA hydratase-related protein [Acidimicrobiales bacterium]